MSEEELKGMLRMIQDQQAQILQKLEWMEVRQIEIKKEVEAEPVQGSFASTDQ